MRFRDAEQFRGGEIVVDLAGQVIRLARRTSELAGRRLLNRSSVEPPGARAVVAREFERFAANAELKQLAR